MINEILIQKLDFEKNGGIIPVIVVEEGSKEVLMLAYMNQTSLELTIKTGRAHYYSRSRNELWLKGETSGHYQYIKEIYSDCDNDTILLVVKQEGVACHTGSKTCFFNALYER